MTKARRPALLAAALAAPALLLGAPALADAPQVPYVCEVPYFGTQSIDMALSTDAPAQTYVGSPSRPTLTLTVVVPGSIVGAAKFFKVTSADANGTYTVGINGVPKAIPAKLERTQIPTSGGDFPFTITMPLPTLQPTVAGTTTYTPGPLQARINLYKEDGSAFGGADVSCVVDPASAPQTIDTVTAAKSPTKAAGTASYAKKSKKLTTTTVLTSTSGVRPTGKVVTVLYRGATRVAGLTGNLVGGRATVVFKGKKKPGSYRTVTTYSGSAAHLSTSTTKSFTIRK